LGKTLNKNYIEIGVIPSADLDGVEKKDDSVLASNQTPIPRSLSQHTRQYSDGTYTGVREQMFERWAITNQTTNQRANGRAETSLDLLSHSCTDRIAGPITYTLKYN